MRNDKILVRLVPKPINGDEKYFELAARAGSALRDFLPDPGRALAALKLLFELGVQSRVTPLSGIEGEAPIKKVEEIFQARVVEDKNGQLKSAEGLKIPEVLKELLAFAYLPKAPEVYAPSPIAPATDTFHLRLEDMAMMLGASRCHRRGWAGKGIPVAVVDSGFAPHPYFEEHGYNISRVGPLPTADPTGHGTGIAANVLAVAPNCHLIGVKLCGSAANSLERAIEQRPRVISCSWGWDIDHTDLMTLHETAPDSYWELVDVQCIIKLAIADGIAVVFAGGNGQRPAPACLPEVLTVGGVMVAANGTFRASNYASAFKSLLYPDRRIPDFCGVVGEAPGKGPAPGHIMLPVPEGTPHEGLNMKKKVPGWGIFSGTSSAAPQVAGVCALMLEQNYDLGQEDLRVILDSTCRDVIGGRSHPSTNVEAVEGPDLATGSGFVDAFAACNRARIFADWNPSATRHRVAKEDGIFGSSLAGA